MTRKYLGLTLAGALLVGAPTVAQLPGTQPQPQLPLTTLEELLQNYYEAIGGLEAWRDLETMKMTGKMQMGPQMEAPFVVMAKRPMKMRLEFTVQGMTGIQAYDGETAWMVMPFMGKTEPEEMPADMAKQLREQADIDGPLVDHEEKGNRLELLGEGDAEGTPAYKIKVTLPEGDERTYYMDGEYFIPIKVESTMTMDEKEMQTETTLSDYKEVAGLMFPHSIESRQAGAPGGQVITIETIEVGVEMPDDQFVMPEPSAEETGEPAAG